ncbi:MAG TPA: beta-N-acetylglucosaminidase domain-containing protein [Verrucomicrobiae bacterium]|nr:beta-N-acetylglucosaminidase domain-containing protein [Verrucomicrobiae bacterium]
MATHKTADFLAGVIEGFYGAPWSAGERVELFDWMVNWGLNSYLYAPKDDLKQRLLWRELYGKAETAQFAELIQACHQRNIRFIYALSPGLDIRYSDQTDLDHLRQRCAQILALGGRHFALLFDDIPDHLEASAVQRWGCLAAAQAHVTNELSRWASQRQPDTRFLFCPTPYCGRMAECKLGGEGYLTILGQTLDPNIDVFWTGPEIISPEIPVASIQDLHKLLHRKPIIWDNLHANDYDGHRFFCGPYAGRLPALRQEVNGLLINPNCEFPLNYVPLRTFGEFLCCQGCWEPRAAYLAAVQEWWTRFATAGSPLDLRDLTLFADAYYLPFEEGPEAQALYRMARELLSQPPSRWGAQAARFREQTTRLRAFCARLPELRDRPLFHALSRRAWELREELDLLERYVEFKSAPDHQDRPFRSDSHLPGTCRGGLVAQLQGLLRFQTDGTIAPPSVSPPIEPRAKPCS